MARTTPYAGTEVSAFIAHRIAELRPRKSQSEIASEAGFVHTNMLSMIKNGATKLPLDRVPALAQALDCDPSRLFQLALGQNGNETTRGAVEEIFKAVVSRNEATWLEAIRAASGNSDPTLTARARAAVFGIFAK